MRTAAEYEIRILNNQEFSDIMASIGLTLGREPDWDNLRYNKVVFLADSDVDGGVIAGRN